MIRLAWTRAFAAVLFAVVVGGCGGSSATPKAAPLTDPTEIVTRTVDGLAGVQTLHVDAKLNGSLDMRALGGLSSGLTTGLSGSLKLDNSSLSADLDQAHQAAHISATVPNLFGLTLDYILIDGYLYGKVNLSGELYTKTKASSVLPSAASIVPSSSFDIAGTVSSFKAVVEGAGVKSTLAGLDQVDGRDAYHVVVSIPNDKLDQAIGAAAGSAADGLTVDSVALDYWAYVDSLQPARIHVRVGSAALGNLDLTVTFTRYNQPVTIAAPPASQVREG